MTRLAHAMRSGACVLLLFAACSNASSDDHLAPDAANRGAGNEDAGGTVAGMHGDGGARADSAVQSAGGMRDSGLAPGDAGGLSHAGADGGRADSGSVHDAGTIAAPGWNLVAIDTPTRTYLDRVEVPASGVWTPESDGFPLLAQGEGVTSHSALRYQPFAAGDVLTPDQIMTLLPVTAPAARSISVTDAPYNAPVAPADAADAIQAALDAAVDMASAGNPVDVIVPPGVFMHSKVLTVGADVRLRGSPMQGGSTLHATDPLHATVHLAGDRSAALFLVLESEASTRDSGPPTSTGVWVGSDTTGGAVTHDVLIVGVEVAQSAGAHFFALAEEGGLWAFNYAHDGYADTFHHTGGSRFCQVVGNRAQTSADRGDDLFAFVGYQADGDAVHHCSCIANWGRDGHARGLSAVGAGFIAFAHNDIDRTQWAGIYLAQESSYATYGTFDVSVLHNTIAHANLGGSHDGLLAYADSPTESHAANSFGSVSNRVERLSIRDNVFRDTAPGTGNGLGIEIRASVDTGDITGNTLSGNRSPQLVDDGTHFTEANNQIR